MQDAYKTLSICGSSKFNGSFNCSKPGLGKTIETFIVAGAIALAFILKDESARDKQKKTASGECPKGNLQGIECCCVYDSLIRKIYAVLNRALQFVIAPASIVKQWGSPWADRYGR